MVVFQIKKLSSSQSQSRASAWKFPGKRLKRLEGDAGSDPQIDSRRKEGLHMCVDAAFLRALFICLSTCRVVSLTFGVGPPNPLLTVSPISSLWKCTPPPSKTHRCVVLPVLDRQLLMLPACQQDQWSQLVQMHSYSKTCREIHEQV